MANTLSKDKQIQAIAALAEGKQYSFNRANERNSSRYDHAPWRENRQRLCAALG
jgi:hypothetical protein